MSPLPACIHPDSSGAPWTLDRIHSLLSRAISDGTGHPPCRPSRPRTEGGTYVTCQKVQNGRQARNGPTQLTWLRPMRCNRRETDTLLSHCDFPRILYIRESARYWPVPRHGMALGGPTDRVREETEHRGQFLSHIKRNVKRVHFVRYVRLVRRASVCPSLGVP